MHTYIFMHTYLHESDFIKPGIPDLKTRFTVRYCVCLQMMIFYDNIYIFYVLIHFYIYTCIGKRYTHCQEWYRL